VDHLVLIRVTSVLAARLEGSALTAIREELGFRIRMRFESGERGTSVLLSLRPEDPWIGRPRGESLGPRGGGGPFAAACRRLLVGARVEAVDRARADRVVTIRMSGGHAVVVELVPHAANAVLVGPSGDVLAAARAPRRSLERVGVGRRYRYPTPPEGQFRPFDQTAEAIDGFVAAAQSAGRSRLEALGRSMSGIGPQVALLVDEEVGRTGRTAGEVLSRRLAELETGALDPVVESPWEPLEAVERGIFEADRCRLLPWESDVPPPEGWWRFRADDAAATAGIYHEAVERFTLASRRSRALVSLVRREVQRVDAAERRALADRKAFGDPARHRLWGEALLASIGRARREGEAIVVPDPYDSSAGELRVPAKPGLTAQAAAETHFRLHRRATRGAERAATRAAELRVRRGRLEAVLARSEGATGREALEAVEAELRALGLPVGLEPPTRAGRAARAGRPRLEGVRLFTTSDGLEMLVGRGGRDNDRLTFKLAAPEDFWFHVHGSPGAHVVVRNPLRRRRPPDPTLREAAAAAAWFSDASRESAVDVVWTRRKNVRRARGGPPGAVLIKRSETVRVRPAAPVSDPVPEGDEGAGTEGPRRL